MYRRETIELVHAYYKIANRELAKETFNLVVAMSKTPYDSGKIKATEEEVDEFGEKPFSLWRPRVKETK